LYLKNDLDLKRILDKFLKSDDKRSEKAKINIFYSIGIKGVSVLTYLLLVPITLKYLNPTEYGIWLTLSSILMWINTFDIGLGNGLRNKLTEVVAKNDWVLARAYISTTFSILTIIMFCVFVLFMIINYFLNWYSILNVPMSLVPNMNKIIIITFVIFCLTFVFKIIGNIFLALQRPAINNLMVMLGQLLALIIIYGCTFFTKGSLLKVAIIYSLSPLVVYIVAIFITFYKTYPQLKPGFSYYRKEYIRDLMSVGGYFFILQIAGLILFSTTNVIISNKFGPEKVTIYNIAYRYFSVVPMLFSIVLTPIWSATTDAYIKEDMQWIRSSMSKVNKLLIATLFLLVIMVFVSPFVYRIWIGDEIEIPFPLTFFMSLYIFILVISLSYSSFLNGIGKLKIQVYNTCIVAALFLPLAFLLSDIYSVLGLTIALIVVNFSGLILNIIQFRKIISGKAFGLWNK
jgi:O-antigen/teichoic acid export membrane protein